MKQPNQWVINQPITYGAGADTAITVNQPLTSGTVTSSLGTATNTDWQLTSNGANINWDSSFTIPDNGS
jgi:hypothetical protein